MLLSIMEYELHEFLENGKSVFAGWFQGLDAVAAARVDRYLRRMEQGNFGDSKRVGSGVLELRIDFGPGYRVYYGREGRRCIILLGGGSKRQQQRDISAAIERWRAYKARGEREWR